MWIRSTPSCAKFSPSDRASRPASRPARSRAAPEMTQAPDQSAGGIFTGERLVADDPLFAADISRHLVAYRFAQERVAGKAVLDAGCGDGYGTNLLAASAASAVGVDRAADTIEVARRR